MKCLFFIQLLTLVLLLPSVKADDLCTSIGQRLSPREVKNPDLKGYCFESAKAASLQNSKLAVQNDKRKISVIGYKNLLYIFPSNDSDSSASVISGDMSKLENIEAVAVSDSGQVIAVLNRYSTVNDETGVSSQSKNILFFKSNQNGNVTPFRLNSHPDLANATALSFDSLDQSVVVLLASSKEVAQFGLEEDSRSPIETKQPQKKVLLKFKPDEQVPTSIAVAYQQLLIFDLQNGLSAFSMTEKAGADRKPAWALPIDKLQIPQAQQIKYNPTKKKILILGKQGHATSIDY